MSILDMINKDIEKSLCNTCSHKLKCLFALNGIVNKCKDYEITPFQWRDRSGKFYPPAEMETRHLFYTLKMIWNHSVPEHMKLKPYKRYTFNSFYTNEYMTKAVKALTAELKIRENIEIYLPTLNKIQMRLKELNNGKATNRHQIESTEGN